MLMLLLLKFWNTERVVVLREEEDREVATALRASLATRSQEERSHERSHVQDRNNKPRKEEKMESDEMRNTRSVTKPPNEMQGRTTRIMVYCGLYLFLAEMGNCNVMDVT